MFNVPDKWSPLQTVVLGRSYSENFYSTIKNQRIRNCLQRIARETEEDFLYFEQQLQSHGVRVHRPQLDDADRIDNYVDTEGKIHNSRTLENGQWVDQITNNQKIVVANSLIPKPPMVPRDYWAVVGNHILKTDVDHPSMIELMQQLDPLHLTIDCQQEFGFSFPGGNIFQIGRDIYLAQTLLSDHSYQAISQKFPAHRWHKINIDGHADSTYHPICPGALISLYDVQTYSETFPGWDVLYLPNQSWDKVQSFMNLKVQNRGKWWLPGEEDNAEFTYFVESWLNNWVGYVEETVFDVNCLVLDEKHVLVTNHNQQVFDFLKKHHMEPIIIPFRHRYFWDGGLHCITLELNRKGILKDYFPVRSLSICS